MTGVPFAAPDEVAAPATVEEQLPESPPRRPLTPRPDPAPVKGGLDTENDRFAADVVTGVEQFWRIEFPAQFGRRWTNIQGFVAADPKDFADPPPCLRRSLDLTNQALYCPRLDTVAWDRTELVPELRANYGDSAVIVALAHEIGHAVQGRLGVDMAAQLREPARYPTILLEGMADCFAGVTLHAVSQGRIPHLSTNPTDLDRALRALLTFRDPVGVAAGHGAHGNAFDRASAFIGGYQEGAGECAAMTVEQTTFTERPYTSLADASRGGNLPVSALLESVGPDLRNWFGRLTTAHGKRWSSPPLLSGVRCATGAVDLQGPARFCPNSPAVTVSREQLAAVHDKYGDYASATVVASRYALAALAAMGRPVVGPPAGRTAVCLSGAYTHDLLGRTDGFELSPGDLDEAVDELLAQDLAARDASGHAAPEDVGYDRVRDFRAGMLGGPDKCGL